MSKEVACAVFVSLVNWRGRFSAVVRYFVLHRKYHLFCLLVIINKEAGQKEPA